VTAGPIDRNRNPENTPLPIGSGVGVGVGAGVGVGEGAGEAAAAVCFVASPAGVWVGEVAGDAVGLPGRWPKIVKANNAKRQTERVNGRSLCTDIGSFSRLIVDERRTVVIISLIPLFFKSCVVIVP